MDEPIEPMPPNSPGLVSSTEGITTAPVVSQTGLVAPIKKSTRRIVGVGVIVVIALVAFFGTKGGLFAPTVGTALDDQLTRQFTPLAGQNSSVTCPPSAKFYAGATIICDVTTVAWNSLMPNLKYVEVVVGTHDLFHVQPVNG